MQGVLVKVCISIRVVGGPRPKFVLFVTECWWPYLVCRLRARVPWPGQHPGTALAQEQQKRLPAFKIMELSMWTFYDSERHHWIFIQISSFWNDRDSFTIINTSTPSPAVVVKGTHLQESGCFTTVLRNQCCSRAVCATH